MNTNIRIDNFIVIGAGGGREASLIFKAKKSSLNCFAVAGHKNPTLVEVCGNDNIIIGKPYEIEVLAELVELIKNSDPSLENSVFWCASDEVLAKGAVDKLTQLGVAPNMIIGPNSNGAKIESDKVYSMKFMTELFPEYTPNNWIIESKRDLDSAFEQLKKLKLEIVVKPLGLTAGKGVKVMGKHLQDYETAFEYAKQLLQNDGSVLLVEKIDGEEFTVMGITDGENTVFTPTSFDYPYRYDGDTGPGTGGMGSYSTENGLLKFINEEDLDVCKKIIKGTLKRIKTDGLHFNGVLYGGFFITQAGIKFIEFNARFGDPECINVMEVLESDFIEMLRGIVTKSLSDKNCKFKKQASVVKYLVPPMYAVGPAESVEFKINVKNIRELGCQVYFSACEQVAENTYKTLGTSRSVAIAAVAANTKEASEKVNIAIKECVSGVLEHRMDIGIE